MSFHVVIRNNGKTLTFDLCRWLMQMYCDACMHALLFVHLYVAQQVPGHL